jgi:elongation factor G
VQTRKRLGMDQVQGPVLAVMKTLHTPHGGKLSIARVLCGRVADAAELYSSSDSAGKISGIYRLLGREQTKLAQAQEGETVALGKLDSVATGDTRAGPARCDASPSRPCRCG